MKIGIRHIAPAAILLSSLFLFPGIPAAQDDRDDVTDAIVRQVPAGEASAQDQPGTHRLNEVVVTATRRAVDRANAPSVVKVITSEEIRAGAVLSCCPAVHPHPAAAITSSMQRRAACRGFMGPAAPLRR